MRLSTATYEVSWTIINFDIRQADSLTNVLIPVKRKIVNIILFRKSETREQQDVWRVLGAREAAQPLRGR